MRTQTILLLGGLAGAIVLLLKYRKGGETVTVDAVEEVVTTVASLFTARGLRNNNPGNIDYIADPKKAWNGQIGSDGRFGIYDTPANGVRAISKELQLDERRGIRSIAGLISNWAPPGENDTAAYITSVARAVGVNPDAAIDVRGNLPVIVAAIIQHENGQQPYSLREINQWVYLA